MSHFGQTRGAPYCDRQACVCHPSTEILHVKKLRLVWFTKGIVLGIEIPKPVSLTEYRKYRYLATENYV